MQADNPATADVIVSLDLSAVPEEVTDYAGDQLRDRFTEIELMETTGSVFGNELVHRDYENQKLHLHQTILTALFRECAREKLSDIEWEVNHDERRDFIQHDVRRGRQALDAAYDEAETTIDLSALPVEVVAFAFDQLQSQVGQWETIDGALNEVLAAESIQWDYDEQRLEFTATIVTQLVEASLSEKLADIEWEVRHDERSDYTEADVQEMRRVVRDVFNGA